MDRLHPRMKSNARKLRSDMTHAERVLWHHLRNRGFHGYKFKRQHVVGTYILDFYCAELALAIELDGGQHSAPENAAYDEARTRELATRGIRVVRYWNDEAEFRIQNVLDDLLRHIEERR